MLDTVVMIIDGILSVLRDRPNKWNFGMAIIFFESHCELDLYMDFVDLIVAFVIAINCLKALVTYLEWIAMELTIVCKAMISLCGTMCYLFLLSTVNWSRKHHS